MKTHVRPYQARGSFECDDERTTFGNLIWSGEIIETEVGGRYSYSVSLALVFRMGPTRGVKTVWAWSPFGNPVALDLSTIKHRIYLGDQTEADPLIVEHYGAPAPTFRGSSFIVLEDLPLGPFNNQIPNFAVEETE